MESLHSQSRLSGKGRRLLSPLKIENSGFDFNQKPLLVATTIFMA
jgi:hypothetical protein